MATQVHSEFDSKSSKVRSKIIGVCSKIRSEIEGKSKVEVVMWPFLAQLTEEAAVAWHMLRPLMQHGLRLRRCMVRLRLRALVETWSPAPRWLLLGEQLCRQRLSCSQQAMISRRRWRTGLKPWHRCLWHRRWQPGRGIPATQPAASSLAR